MQTVLFLARHGETYWNKERRFQGHLDSGLTELGKSQSQQILAHVIDQKIDVIVSSPLERAKATARICQTMLKVDDVVEPRLMERNLGDWQGKKLQEIACYPEYHEALKQVTDFTPRNGESANACSARIYHALKDISQRYLGRKILVIFHGEALRCLLAMLGEKSEVNAYELYQNGCVITLNYQPTAPFFQQVN
ncbi:histidine phosphatase family protein [Thalassotalea sediminis]|uniref:histidine phosphatase family protein n=1 Tax=Thalassotalea sediminis TaxID=1759089 RepID=UPI002572C068|nr:histidine phosphatase family protein [Thalassotalea sediminis]